MKPIINHFTDNDLYTFTCMYYILQKYPRAETEYCFLIAIVLVILKVSISCCVNSWNIWLMS